MSSQQATDQASQLSSSCSSSQSAISPRTRTISEIHPGDSASRREVKADLPSEDAGAPGGVEESPSQLSSVVTLRSSEEANLYKVIDGRAFNSSSDLYVLPADNEEHARLDMQHFSICLTMDSLFPFKDLVKQILREGQAERPQILDMGTGSGRWAVDMAVAYPSADVLGIDLVPPASVPKDNLPQNCRFEVDDANLSMKHYADKFSLIHARWIETGLNDAESFLYEMARILKPGGLLLVGSGDAQWRGEDFRPIPWVQPGEPGFSWSQWCIGHAYKAHWNRGSTALNATLWFQEWLDANPNYSKTYTEDVYMPIGPWKEGMNERDTYAANLKLETIIRVVAAWRRLLLADGHNDQDVSEWIEGSTRELQDLSVHLYDRCKFVAAVRSEAPFEERGMATEVDFTSRCQIHGMELTKH